MSVEYFTRGDASRYIIITRLRESRGRTLQTIKYHVKDNRNIPEFPSNRGGGNRLQNFLSTPSVTRELRNVSIVFHVINLLCLVYAMGWSRETPYTRDRPSRLMITSSDQSDWNLHKTASLESHSHAIGYLSHYSVSFFWKDSFWTEKCLGRKNFTQKWSTLKRENLNR